MTITINFTCILLLGSHEVLFWHCRQSVYFYWHSPPVLSPVPPLTPLQEYASPHCQNHRNTRCQPGLPLLGTNHPLQRAACSKTTFFSCSSLLKLIFCNHEFFWVTFNKIELYFHEIWIFKKSIMLWIMYMMYFLVFLRWSIRDN